MKITKTKLKQIIKEELASMLDEKLENVTKMPSGLVVYRELPKDVSAKLKDLVGQKVLIIPREIYRRHITYLRYLEQEGQSDYQSTPVIGGAKIVGRYMAYNLAKDLNSDLDLPQDAISKLGMQLTQPSCNNRNLRKVSRQYLIDKRKGRPRKVQRKSLNILRKCFAQEIGKLMKEYEKKSKADAEAGYRQAVDIPDDYFDNFKAKPATGDKK